MQTHLGTKTAPPQSSSEYSTLTVIVSWLSSHKQPLNQKQGCAFRSFHLHQAPSPSQSELTHYLYSKVFWFILLYESHTYINLPKLPAVLVSDRDSIVTLCYQTETAIDFCTAAFLIYFLSLDFPRGKKECVWTDESPTSSM